MHTPFPPIPFEDPGDSWRKIAFDTFNSTFNFEGLQRRVSLSHWFEDDPQFGVTGFGSVLYDAQVDFFVNDDPIPAAIDHIRAQLNNVENEILSDGRVRIARTPQQVENYPEAGEKFIFH